MHQTQWSTNRLCDYFLEGVRRALAERPTAERRIGAELKFPLVNRDGTAASFETVCSLWAYLVRRGWRAVRDNMTGQVIGARKAGEYNDTVAGCETGYCKMEFSLAHVGTVFDLERQIVDLRQELHPYCKEHGVCFLGYGIQPVSPPSKHLMMKKRRTSPWVKVFGSNRHITEEDGDDVHLFTINAATHVHVSTSADELIPAVNVLNGFAAAQIALTAHSNVWQGTLDSEHKCVAEAFWDWWMPNTGRVGMPHRLFHSLEDYIRTVAAFRPVYIERNGNPIILEEYDTFEQYYRSSRAVGIDTKGREVSFIPELSDIDLHNTCYWFNTRISQYYTVENRTNDQQPPDELVCVPALTLGLIEALPEGLEELSRYDWQKLRAARRVAYRQGLLGRLEQIRLLALAEKMLLIARKGLRSRQLGEEQFLRPLEKRIVEMACPADETEMLFRSGGIDRLVSARKL